MIPCATSGCAPGSRSRALERLAEADAFRSLGLDRRDALWAVRALDRSAATRTTCRSSHARRQRELEPDARLPPMPLGEHVIDDYRALCLSLKAHPVSFLRQRLAARGIIPRTAALPHGIANGRSASSVAGLVLVRQRPGIGERRHLHDARGRDRRRQHHRLAEGLRTLPRDRARRAFRRGHRQAAERIRRHPRRRRADGGPDPLLNLLSGRGAGLSALARADEIKRPQNLRIKADIAAHAQRLVQTEMKEMLPKGRNFH